jgi:signal transduction histidine kinase
MSAIRPSTTVTSDSFGLRAMAQRVDQLGGRLDVDSAPGRGTTITAILEVEPS